MTYSNTEHKCCSAALEGHSDHGGKVGMAKSYCNTCSIPCSIIKQCLRLLEKLKYDLFHFYWFKLLLHSFYCFMLMFNTLQC